MKESKKALIEKYVNLRCKKLQEQQYPGFITKEEDPSAYANMPNINTTYTPEQNQQMHSMFKDMTTPIDNPELFTDQERTDYLTDYAKRSATFGISPEELKQIGGTVANSMDIRNYYDIAKDTAEKTIYDTMYNEKPLWQSMKQHGGHGLNQALDLAQTAGDAVGIIDPTGLIDAANAGVSIGRAELGSGGDPDKRKAHYKSAVGSLFGAVPGVIGIAGGLGKIHKMNKSLYKTGKHADKLGSPTQLAWDPRPWKNPTGTPDPSGYTPPSSAPSVQYAKTNDTTPKTDMTTAGPSGPFSSAGNWLKDMFGSRNEQIQKYVDLRCDKLLKEQWGDFAKDIFHAGLEFQPLGSMYNQFRDFKSYRDDLKSGTDKKTALKNMIDKSLDRKQMSLDIGGAFPIVGAIPDLANMAISSARAGYEHKHGDPNKAADHENYAALSGISAIPIAGYGGLVSKYGPRIAKMMKLGTKGATKGEKYTDKYDLDTGTGDYIDTAGPPKKGIFSKIYDFIKNPPKSDTSNDASPTHTKDHKPITLPSMKI